MISRFFKKHKFLFTLAALIALLAFWFLFVDLFLENEELLSYAPENISWVEVGGNKVAYQYFPGAGQENIVAIGGTTAWSGVWEKTAEELNDRYNLYAIDLPPFGFSLASEDYKYNLANQADLINGFLKELNLQNVIFIAHSYGAGPVMEAVLRDPDNYEKLIIIDGAIHVDRERNVSGFVKNLFSISTLRYLVSSAALHLPGFIEASLKYLVHDNSKIDKYWVDVYTLPLAVEGSSRRIGKWFYDFVFENGRGFSSDGANYRNLAVPVLIIWGREDTFTPLEQGWYLKKIIPKSELAVLDGVGHIPMIDDHEAYTEVLSEYLNR